MNQPDEPDPRDADVVDPSTVPDAVKPSTTGTVASGDDDDTPEPDAPNGA